MAAVLRQIRRTDIDQVIALQAAALPGVSYDRARIWDGLFDTYRHTSFVAVLPDDTVIGFVLSWDDLICSFAVDEKHRRHAVGKHLLCLCLNAHFGESVRLHVSTLNTAAHRLYTNVGFVEGRRRPNYYKHPPSDALMMERPAEASRWFEVPYMLEFT